MRVRDLVTWVVMFSGLETLDALMGKYITEYQAYQKIIEAIADLSQTEYIKPALKFIMRHHAGELYKTAEGSAEISAVVVQKYLTEILCYSSDKPGKDKGSCSVM